MCAFVITRDSFNARFLLLLLGVELFSRYTKIASKMSSTTLSDLKWGCQKYPGYRTFLSRCGFIVFGPHILQKPRGKSINSILALNTFVHEKHVPTSFYRKWKPTTLQRTEYIRKGNISRCRQIFLFPATPNSSVFDFYKKILKIESFNHFLLCHTFLDTRYIKVRPLVHHDPLDNLL